jgi:uncharacterized coiled-coil protein SlyX
MDQGVTPEQAEQLQAMNATQEKTIKELWVQNAALQKQVDKLQGMYDNSQEYIGKLKAQLTDEAIAERVFG